MCGLGTASQRAAPRACRHLPPQIDDARCEIPSRVVRVPGCVAFRKLLQLFGESGTGGRQFAVWYRERHGQSTYVPDERCQFAGNRHDSDVDGLTARRRPAKSSAQPHLGVPGAVDDGLGQAVETDLDFRTDAGGMAAIPCGLDQQVSGVAVADFGNAALSAFASRRMLGWRYAKPGDQLAR